MQRPYAKGGKKNITGEKVLELRTIRKMSQRDLAHKLQLIGCDMDKSVITRIENNKRYVADYEVKAFAEAFEVPCGYFFGEVVIDIVGYEQQWRDK